MKLRVVIQEDDELGYIVQCVELPQCLVGGRTVEELKKNMNEVITKELL
jgi:predicted RNase H-like HicB family nuclease